MELLELNYYMFGMKKYYKVLVLLSIIVIIVIVVIIFLNTDRNWKDIENSKQIKVVTTYSPINYYVNTEGDIDGYNYTILKMFADSLGYSLEVTVENNLESCMTLLKKGDFDILLNLFPITLESKSVTSFSTPILSSHLALVQLKSRYINDKTCYISDLYQLNGKKIYVEKGSFNNLVLKNLRSELGIDYEILEIDDANLEMLCGMIIQDEINYVAIDKFAEKSIISDFPLLDATIELGIEQPFAWPVNDKTFKEKLDSFIIANSNSEWFIRLNKEYLQ